jgi:hypothetical protein
MEEMTRQSESGRCRCVDGWLGMMEGRKEQKERSFRGFVLGAFFLISVPLPELESPPPTSAVKGEVRRPVSFLLCMNHAGENHVMISTKQGHRDGKGREAVVVATGWRTAAGYTHRNPHPASPDAWT